MLFPPAQVYSPPKKDMSWTGLPEFADDTITDYSRPSPSIESNLSELQNSNPSVYKHEESSNSIMSKPMIKFFKAADSPTVIKSNKVEIARKPPVKYDEMYTNTSQSPNVRGNQRNWNNLKSQQLGKDFLMENKACFKCGHFDHLAYDCGVWVEKGKTWPKNNFAHKNVTPRADLLKIASVSAARKNTDSLNTKISKLNEALGESKTNLYHYKLGLSQVKKEKEGLDRKPTCFESAAKDLDTLLGSQRTDKNMEGLGPSPSIESNLSEFQNSNPFVSKHEESSNSIMSKPMIKFFKAADSPTVIKSNKVETARKPPVKYVEMYTNTSQSPKVRGKTWPKNNFAHKNVTPRADLLKTTSVSAARRVNTAALRPNVKMRDQRLLKIWDKIKRFSKGRIVGNKMLSGIPTPTYGDPPAGAFSHNVITMTLWEIILHLNISTLIMVHKISSMVNGSCAYQIAAVTVLKQREGDDEPESDRGDLKKLK
nr:zinc finger, PARP-type [Tanacetum cinerariifolium]